MRGEREGEKWCRLSSKSSHGDGDFLGLLFFPLGCNRIVVSRCAVDFACRQQGVPT